MGKKTNQKVTRTKETDKIFSPDASLRSKPINQDKRFRADYTLNTLCVLSRGYTRDPFSLCQKVVTLDSIKLSSALVAAGACVVHVCCGLIKLTEAPVMDGARQERRATNDAVLLPLPSFRRSTRSAGAGPRGTRAGGRSTRSVGAGPQSLWGPIHEVLWGRSTRSVEVGPQSLWGSVHEISWGRSTNSLRAGPLLL